MTPILIILATMGAPTQTVGGPSMDLSDFDPADFY